MEYEQRYPQLTKTAKYECLLFDLDDTLYSKNYGWAEEIAKNICEFMVQRLGVDEKEVVETNRFLYKTYGTSMAGLKAVGFNFDYDDYHRFAHGRLPYEKLKPDHVLRNLLLSLPMKKIIFSNGDKVHVTKTLCRLGLQDCFEGIICFETFNPTTTHTPGGLRLSGLRPTTNFSSEVTKNYGASKHPKTSIICKPFEAAYELAFKKANIDPKSTLFFDDSIPNLQAGKRWGLRTVLVGHSQRSKGADYALESIHNMKEALPELWDADGQSLKRRVSEKIALETLVIA